MSKEQRLGTNAFRRVMLEVMVERGKQDGKWGEQNHDPFTWLTILGEEVGEACEAALESKFGKWGIDQYRDELIQVAAVAVAMIECIDRKERNR